ncbi:MAG: hypothetical protein R3B48_18060 [Kofleriaceae bacterium]
MSEEILAANERAGEDGDWFEGPLYQVNDEAPEITFRSALPLVYGFWNLRIPLSLARQEFELLAIFLGTLKSPDS